jgi:hypothetical protein
LELPTRDFADPLVLQHVACLANVVAQAPPQDRRPVDAYARFEAVKAEAAADLALAATLS